jgi:hypothetical protein
MVVIPTSHHVRLHYGYTPVDVLGLVLSLVGVGGVIWLARRKLVWPPSPRHFRRDMAAPPGSWTPDGDELTEPYERLEYELAGAFPVGGRPDWRPEGAADDLDVWLGFPAGMDPASPHVPNGSGAVETPPPPTARPSAVEKFETFEPGPPGRVDPPPPGPSDEGPRPEGGHLPGH